ncbi:10469_t:CDS:10, partial [Acaulospora morrowiae]
MSLWVDKYRPTSLEELTYHQDLSHLIKTMTSASDFPHLLMYGPSGAGKKTRICCILKELFGEAVEKIKVDQRTFVTPSNKKLDVNIVSSVYHLELTPSDVGNYDRVVIQELIKDVAQTQQVDVKAKQRFKVIVINEADALGRDAQAALRRTMEKYISNIRIIFCCGTTSKIIAPIRSRCLLVRVAGPTVEEIAKVIRNIAEKENISLHNDLAIRIGERSEGNLRKAILTFESMVMQQPNLGSNSEIPLQDWEGFVESVAKTIMKAQTPTNVLKVRTDLYELLNHCIPASVILKKLAFTLIKNVHENIKTSICAEAAFYEHRLRTGQKAIIHLEAFVIKVMYLILSEKNKM